MNSIIKTAVEARASDIHIEPEEKEFRVRFRISRAASRRYRFLSDGFSSRAATPIVR